MKRAAVREVVAPAKSVRIEIAYRLQSAANLREHHFAKAARSKEQRQLARMHLEGALLGAKITARFAKGKDASTPVLWGPVVVVLTRRGKRRLDGHDNLRSAFKNVVDGIADAMGTRDDDPRIEWTYGEQEIGEYAIRIEVRKKEAA